MFRHCQSEFSKGSQGTAVNALLDAYHRDRLPIGDLSIVSFVLARHPDVSA